MYHTNFGGGRTQECGEEDEAAWEGGLLGQGSRMVAPTQSITPFTTNAARAVSEADVYNGPVNGFKEEVFKRVPLSDGNGMASATLINPLGDRGMTMSWLVEQMPYLTQVTSTRGFGVTSTPPISPPPPPPPRARSLPFVSSTLIQLTATPQWKNTAATKSGYVTGIEPGTCYPHHRAHEREHGRVAKLAPGESRTFQLHFRVLASEQEVKSACEAAAKVQGQSKPQVMPLEK